MTETLTTTRVSVWLAAILVTSVGFAAPPAELGQCAFAALAEMATTLDEDATTDWSRVSLLALREHLVDMDEVVMRAEVEEQAIEGGLRVRLAGQGRTLEALRRMVPAHSRMMRAMPSVAGLQIDLRERADGFDLDLTTDDPAAVDRLRGLGFFGFLVAGDHHRHHHFGLARGARPHGHHAHR